MEKKIYIVVLSLIVGFACLGAAFGLFGAANWAFLFCGLAVSLIPVVSHLRMRRMLNAMRRLRGDGGHIDDDYLKSLETSVSKLNQRVETVAAALSNSEVSQLARLANEIRRESRMIRLKTEGLQR